MVIAMHSRLISWSRYALLAGIVLALVLVVPTAWFPFQLSKVTALSLCLLASVILFVVGGGVRDLLRTHGLYAALGVGLLPLVYLVSAALSSDRSLSLTGFGVETDTVLFVLLAAVCYVMSFTLFRTLRTARQLSMVVFWALVAAAVFQFVSIIFGSAAIPFATFADRSVNLVGKWNDLGLLSALLALMLFARVELSPASNLWKIISALAGVALAALLGFINFALAWILLLVGSIVLGALALIRQRAEHREGSGPVSTAQIVPWYATAGAIVSILFLLYGSSINATLTSIFPVQSLEVRPGLQATLDVINASRQGSLQTLLGTGPSTFGSSWLAHKPAAVNQTPFWNLDFNVGYSTLATAFGTTGIVGALAWLVPLILLGVALIRAARLSVLSREERVTATTISLSAFFLFAAIIFYVPSQNIVILAFVLSGAAFGFLWRQGRPAEDMAATPSLYEGVAVLALAAVLLLSTVVGGATTARRFASQAYTGQGLAALQAGRVDDALASAVTAARIEATPDALRLQSDAGLQKLAQIAQDNSLKPEDARAQFTATVQSVIPAAQAAIAAAPSDYRGYYSLARIYDLLSTLKIEGAYQSAQTAYAAAAQHNPTSPTIPLARARLEAANNNAQGMQEHITKALQLKPDYTDAILFVVQINVANNDLASAIRNTQAAVQSAPGVASIWFQLGLLYYAGGDSKNAIAPLEQALALVGDYANAKYFLGLAYYAQGRQNDSLRLFEELAQSNPDNAEVKAIVANLKAGKNPLDGLQQDSKPQSRTTAPVEQ